MFSRAALAFATITTFSAASPAFDAASALVHARHITEARAAFEQLVRTEPENAAAWHELGRLWQKRTDDTGSETALRCLAKAAELEPNNGTFLADFGGASLEYAGRTRSLSAATRGRDAMEKAVALSPDNLDAREGLYQFYTQAPFFIGGSAKKAALQLEEIRRRDPDRALMLDVVTKTNARDFAAAFAECDDVLRRNPDHYAALVQYGRTASLSGQNLARGLACLQHALELPPPGPPAPKPTQVWYRVGTIQLKLGHPAEARQAYATAVKLDGRNQLAAKALEGLKP